MATSVVYNLELIEIKIHQRIFGFILLNSLQGFYKSVFEFTPVYQPGEAIVSCFVDKLWADWQAQHSSEGYLPSSGGPQEHNLNDPMFPWQAEGATPASVWNHRDLGYVYEGEESLLAAEGKVTFLRVHDVGTGWGPPTDFLDVEVVIKIDSEEDRAFGFQLRDDTNENTHRGMVDLLRDAFNRDGRVRIDYIDRAGLGNAKILRVMSIP